MESSFLGTTLLRKPKEEVKASEALATAPVIAVYFSAHWCPPCRKFTPILAELYKKWNAKNKRIEIIFVSRDKDEKMFNEYFETMPWLAVPFSNTDVVNSLRTKYSISGIPTLVIVDKNGKCLSMEGRDEVDDNNEKAIEVFEALK